MTKSVGTLGNTPAGESPSPIQPEDDLETSPEHFWDAKKP